MLDKMPERMVILIIGIAACVCAGGCQAARVERPLTMTVGGNDADAQSEFWYELAMRPVACNDEAFHAILLYLDKRDPAIDYAARVAELKRRGLLAAAFNRPDSEAIERGTLAVAIVGILKIKGGLMMTLFGPNPRYSMRELQYLNLYPRSSEAQEFSGLQVVGIIGKLEDYQRGDSSNVPAAVMPGEMTSNQTSAK